LKKDLCNFYQQGKSPEPNEKKASHWLKMGSWKISAVATAGVYRISFPCRMND